MTKPKPAPPGRGARWLVAALAGSYVVWVAIGVCLLWPPEPPAEKQYIAARVLPVGHRLVSSDVVVVAAGQKIAAAALSPEDFDGQYVLQEIPRGQPILPDRIAERPSIALAPGRAAYFVPLEAFPELIPYLDAGSRVTLCWAREKCIENNRVIAVTCEGDDKKCVAIADLPGEQLKIAGARKDLRLFLH